MNARILRNCAGRFSRIVEPPWASKARQIRCTDVSSIAKCVRATAIAAGSALARASVIVAAETATSVARDLISPFATIQERYVTGPTRRPSNKAQYCKGNMTVGRSSAEIAVRRAVKFSPSGRGWTASQNPSSHCAMAASVCAKPAISLFSTRRRARIASNLMSRVRARSLSIGAICSGRSIEDGSNGLPSSGEKNDVGNTPSTCAIKLRYSASPAASRSAPHGSASEIGAHNAATTGSCGGSGGGTDNGLPSTPAEASLSPC